MFEMNKHLSNDRERSTEQVSEYRRDPRFSGSLFFYVGNPHHGR